MALYYYGNSSKLPPPRTGITEFEILKANHKFLRKEDDEGLTWEEKLASKYYSSLYREFAVCDLKHYKSGNFALRWRTEDEVISGAGETTCGNTRCEHHTKSSNTPPPALTTLELPFAYAEHGENKYALVKVVLCPRCLDKLMWKRRKERERMEQAQGGEEASTSENGMKDRRKKDGTIGGETEDNVMKDDGSRHESRHRSGHGVGDDRRRKRNSRSRSPRNHEDRSESSRHRDRHKERKHHRYKSKD